MPYDDSNVKKMIRYQTERKVGFSRSKKIADDAKELIHGMLEAEVNKRLTMSQALEAAWLRGVVNPLTAAEKLGPPLSAPSPGETMNTPQPQSSGVGQPSQSNQHRLSQMRPTEQPHRPDSRDMSKQSSRAGNGSHKRDHATDQGETRISSSSQTEND